MPTPSVRLSDNTYRAVKNSDYSISELARDGIEQAIVGELVSVCWICGEGIHRRERRDWIDTDRFENDIARGNTESQHWKSWVNHREYQRFVKQERRTSKSDNDLYFTRVGMWLNLPGEKQPVELCSSCAEYIDQVRNQEIRPSEIPIPYQYRTADPDADNDLIDEWWPEPQLAYAAESAAVSRANYHSFQKYLFDACLEDDEERSTGSFWWAAKGRGQNIIDTDTHPWVEIALRSNAQRLLSGKPPVPIFKWALEAANSMGENWYAGGSKPPGCKSAPVPDGSESCVACGSKASVSDYPQRTGVLEYCDACLFVTSPCPNGHEGCTTLQPYVQGDTPSKSKISLYCYNCEHGEPASEGFVEKFTDRYESIFKEIKRVVPPQAE